MVRKEKLKKPFRFFIFVIGFLLCCYPLVSGIVGHHNQQDLISTYGDKLKEQDETKIQEALKSAEKYNSVLYQTMGAMVGNSSDILGEDNYKKLLDLTETGIMGSIEIPKINVDLPIYHGTSDEVLSKGVGHVMDSSLPVGGKSTRSILTGHRGLPTAKLFTRLDEMDKGDFFFVNVCNQTLAYQVTKIEEIKPEDVDKLNIEADKDLVSLITCTPYGLNTHRLVVTGERVEYDEKQKQEIKSQMMSPRELIFTVLPFVFFAVFIYMILKERKESKSKYESKEEN